LNFGLQSTVPSLSSGHRLGVIHWICSGHGLVSIFVCLLLLISPPVLAQPNPISLMVFRDIHVEGWGGKLGFRYPLWFSISDAGFDVEFVGGRLHNYDIVFLDLYPDYNTTFNRHHEGYSFVKTDALVNSATSAATAYKPDVVLILAGMADVWYGGQGGLVNFGQRLHQVIAEFRKQVPGVNILLGQIPPWDTYPAGNNREFVPNKVYIPSFNPETMFCCVDKFMPSVEGYEWIANNFFEVLEVVLPDIDPSGSGEFQINAGHAGAWFNADTPGQGQLIDVEPEGQFMFVSWFTFTGAVSANPNEQHWFTAQGNYSGNTADLLVYETLGGRFDDPQEVSTVPAGEATLSFTDCSSGQLDYAIDTWDLQGSFTLQRAIPGTENVCEKQAEISTEPLEPNDGWDGA
jgi:hypothetical protein